MKPVVSIIVLTYNSHKHLPDLFTSIAKQTYEPIELIVVDNASADDTVVWLRQQTIRKIDAIITNDTNDWYAKGNNAGVRVSHGDYIVFCNDDIVLEPNCVEQLITASSEHPSAGMIGGKLLKLTKTEQGSIVDSAGLAIRRTNKVINRGENEVDTGQYDVPGMTFGITGALMCVKRTALEDVAYNGEYFDEDFVAYKEDVDLSWRMWRTGYHVWYQPTAVAYHARTIQQATLQQRTLKPSIIRAYSYRNHFWVLWKNESFTHLLRNIWAIIPYELLKLGYVLVAEWSSLKIIPELLKTLPRMSAKRNAVQHAEYSRNLWLK